MSDMATDRKIRRTERRLADGQKPVTCYDLARRLGIVGLIRSSPRDLYTNRKYFRGFGAGSLPPPKPRQKLH